MVRKSYDMLVAKCFDCHKLWLTNVSGTQERDTQSEAHESLSGPFTDQVTVEQVYEVGRPTKPSSSKSVRRGE
jgi:hypothetical protein